VRLTRTLANGSTTSLIKVAAIASPRGYQYPALGERGDPQASLVNAGSGVVAATERNPGGSVRGYHGFYRKVIELLELLGRRSSVSANFNLASGAASLNVSVANDFQAGNEITQATVITLTNGLDGDHGVVAIKQDSTGYAVTFVAAGRAIRYVGSSVPVTASASLRCRYEFRSVVGQPCLDIYPSAVV
jgi:hypothetical protein